MTDETMKKATYTLLKDVATLKEAFIIDELQSYMDLSDPSNPTWSQAVRLRLLEIQDYKQKVREVIDKAKEIFKFKKQENELIMGNDYEIFNDKLSVLDWIEKELGFEK